MKTQLLTGPCVRDVLQKLSFWHDDYRVSLKHDTLLSKIFISDIMIAGVEVIPWDVSRAQLSDTLVCIPVSRLISVSEALNVMDSNSGDSFVYDYVGIARNILRSCLGLPRLICNIDHLWLELDSAPYENLSFFLGSSSLIQSDKEINEMVSGASSLVNAINIESEHALSGLQACVSGLMQIRQVLNKFAGIGWHISEIGLMTRKNYPHLKVLISPSKRIMLADLSDLKKNIDSAWINLPSLPVDNKFIEASKLYPHECKLSLSITPAVCSTAIEVKPEFSSLSFGAYQDFWNEISRAFSRTECDLSERMSDSYTQFEFNGATISSRLHHFKFATLPCGSDVFKYYRDVRASVDL